MIRLPKYIESSDGTLWLTEEEKEHVKVSYRIKNVLTEEQSRFQHVMVLDSAAFGPMLVLDGIVQTTAIDGFIYNEMITHMPLSLHRNPRRVLIIGGGDLGAAREATKYDSVEHIDLVEIDEAVVRACMAHLPEVSGGRELDPRIHIHSRDGVEFVKQLQDQDRYDVIIVDSSDPIGPATQLFELSFYRELHRALNEDGILVCQSQSPIFHQDVMTQTYARISSLFPDTRMYTAVVPTYPGGLWSFTLGAKQALPETDRISFDKQARYVNEAILRSSFALPAFVERLLKEAMNARA
jgi:spermidine synthase